MRETAALGAGIGTSPGMRLVRYTAILAGMIAIAGFALRQKDAFMADSRGHFDRYLYTAWALPPSVSDMRSSTATNEVN